MRYLIEYVENPEKTVVTDKQEQDFLNVFSYTWNPVKTAGGQYVTAINCQKDIALQQMVLTKKQYGKDDGYIAWHGYQSFKPGEVTPEECHAIGVAFAREMWGDRFQIIVTTHLDRGHLHNHEAIIAVVDSNLHREHLLPSEKAFAYKMKADALKHQGKRTDLTSEQFAPKLSTAQIGDEEKISKDTVKRYIRLTYLIPELRGS